MQDAERGEGGSSDGAPGKGSASVASGTHTTLSGHIGSGKDGITEILTVPVIATARPRLQIKGLVKGVSDTHTHTRTHTQELGLDYRSRAWSRGWVSHTHTHAHTHRN